jgi:hypothetical protein
MAGPLLFNGVRMDFIEGSDNQEHGESADDEADRHVEDVSLDGKFFEFLHDGPEGAP